MESKRISSRLVACIIALSLLIPAHAQRKEAIKTIALYSTSIVLSAVGDGMNDSGNKVLGHALNATSTGLLVASPFILNVRKDNWGWYAASYLTLRVGLFDPAYNLSRGLPIEYVGNSSIWDKTVAATKSPKEWNLAGRGFCMMLGVVIPLNEI
jgi:hypothetical protein